MTAACKFCGQVLDAGRLPARPPKEQAAAEFIDLAEMARAHIARFHSDLAHSLSAVLLLPGRYLTTLILDSSDKKLGQQREAMKAELLELLAACQIVRAEVVPASRASGNGRLIVTH